MDRAPAPLRVPFRAAVRALERVEAHREERRRVPWPVPVRGPGQRVGAVVVNYNTAQMTVQLVFSLLRVLEPDLLTCIVVVDNASRDDAARLLPGLHEAGVITLLAGARPPQHGPGLNVGMSFLAAHQDDPRFQVDYVWVLDSDVIALRPGGFSAAVAAMSATQAPLAGQVHQRHRVFDGYAHVSSLVIDPARVWQLTLPPFQPDDEPGVVMQRAMADQGIPVADVRFYQERYLLHLGRGTSFAIGSRKDRLNRNYRYSRAQVGHHFEGDAEGPRLYQDFWRTFAAEVPTADVDVVVDACRRATRLTFT